MLAVVLAYSCALGSYDYTDRENHSQVNKCLDVLCFVLTGLFVLEVVVKIIAQGLWQYENAFLRNAWNTFDVLMLIVLYYASH